MANIMITILVLGGLPLIHFMLLIKRFSLNVGVEKKFMPKKKNNNILEKARDHADGKV